MATAEQALSALAPLKDAGSGRSLLELAWIDQVRAEGQRMVFRLALPGYANAQRERIASEARQDLERLFGGPVYLEVWVKVRGGWSDNEQRLRTYGYD